jgi:hypothetical protein
MRKKNYELFLTFEHENQDDLKQNMITKDIHLFELNNIILEIYSLIIIFPVYLGYCIRYYIILCACFIQQLIQINIIYK